MEQVRPSYDLIQHLLVQVNFLSKEIAQLKQHIHIENNCINISCDRFHTQAKEHLQLSSERIDLN